MLGLESLHPILNHKDYIASRHRWRKRNAYYYKDILRLLKYLIPTGSSVLEFGHDDGWFLKELQAGRGVFIGASKPGVKHGRSVYPDLEYFEDPGDNSIDLDDGKFNYILMINTIGSIPHLLPYFRRVLKFSKPETRLVVTYYNYIWQPWVRLAEKIGLKQPQPIQNWVSPHDVHNLLELAGFEVIKDGRRMLLPKWLPGISWFFNRVIGRLPLFNRLGFWNYFIARPKPHHFEKASQSVSVIVPARNEKGNIRNIVSRVPEMGSGTEIIFVEGGSTDGTWEEIVKVAEEFKHQKNIVTTQQEGKGKGDAVRKGFKLASKEVLMILDADLTVPPEDLPTFYETIESRHAEYVHGSRLVYPLEEGAMRFLNNLANKFFSTAFSWILKQRIKDTLCGTKVLKKEHYLLIEKNRSYFGEFDPFGDFDLIFGASKLGLKMAEIPVHYKQRKYGETNISRFRHGWILLKMLFFSLRKLE